MGSKFSGTNIGGGFTNFIKGVEGGLWEIICRGCESARGSKRIHSSVVFFILILAPEEDLFRSKRCADYELFWNLAPIT